MQQKASRRPGSQQNRLLATLCLDQRTSGLWAPRASTAPSRWVQSRVEVQEYAPNGLAEPASGRRGRADKRYDGGKVVQMSDEVQCVRISQGEPW